MVKNISHPNSKEKRVSIDQYNTEIEFALKEVKRGKSISHHEVLKQIRKCLKRK